MVKFPQLTSDVIMKDIKEYLGLADNSKDALLKVIVRNTMSALILRLDGLQFDDNLSFIVVEVSVARFNRLGSEGMKAQTVDVMRQEFLESDFAPYETMIDMFVRSKKGSTGSGSVRFL